LDVLFYVNVGLIVLFFGLCGSRFILAPGLGVEFQMPTMSGATVEAIATDRFISVLPSGQIFADGLMNMDQLRDWLRTEARKFRDPSLLVRASVGVPISQLTAIVSAAKEAGFTRVVWGVEEQAEKQSLPE
jgi:biopolymer transport protein ExbD